jgi:hypothetical protein
MARIGDDLPPFRFGLRQLLAFVTITCLLMTAMVLSGGLIALALVLATLVVVFHVFSTALGTQLRSHADHLRIHNSSQQGADQRAQSAGPRINATPQPRSPWHERRSTPLPWLPRLVAAAALLSGVLGAILLNVTIGHRTSLAGIAVGSSSLAVVGGWFAFVGYSFYGVFRHGLRDAMAEDQRHRSQ